MRPIHPAMMAASLLLATVAGCSPEPSSPPAGEAGAVTSAAAGTLRAADGVPIVYEASGAGDTAVVFVHCWACNRGFWRNQVAAIVAAGYRVVTLDLPGHGASGAQRTGWSIEALAADVQKVVSELGLQRIVLVGHSMGGPVSLATARRMPGRVIGVACVDTLHNAEFEWPDGMAEDLAARMRQDYRGGLQAFVPQLFRADAEPELVQWVIDQAAASDLEATVALMAEFPSVDQRALFSNAGVPIRCINAAPDGEQGFPTEVEINRKYSDFAVVLMDGVGHYPQLERPTEFNANLLRVLAELAAVR